MKKDMKRMVIMNQYILVNKKKLYAFSRKYGFTAKFNDGKWHPSNISYMSLLEEKDEECVEISEDEAMILTKQINPAEYFEKLHDKLRKIAKR